MLKSLVESKFITKFLIIEDKEDLSYQNLFVSFLENCLSDNSVKKINLVCYENPPKFYLSSKKCTDEKITFYNYFANPLGWSDPLEYKTDLSFFLSDVKNLSETAFFIDSVSTLVHYHGFYTSYRNLALLKEHSKKVICAAHGDLFSNNQLEELGFLASAYIKLQGFLDEKNSEEKICEITYCKPGGKVIKQKEIFFIDDNLKVTSKIQQYETPAPIKIKEDLESLTTFKLGIHISEEERKQREKLILPYVKTDVLTKGEEFTSQSLLHDLEDDPDDDLDI